jgi:hypothetical protein
MVVHVLAQETAQMLFVQRNDLVQEFAADASHPALRKAIPPGCLHTGALRFETGTLEKREDVGVELCITIQNLCTGRVPLPEMSPAAAAHPGSSGMTGGVAM